MTPPVPQKFCAYHYIHILYTYRYIQNNNRVFMFTHCRCNNNIYILYCYSECIWGRLNNGDGNVNGWNVLLILLNNYWLTILQVHCPDYRMASQCIHINAFLRHCIRHRFCSPDLNDITVIFNAADETLFRKILSDGNHLLAPLLPSEVCTPYYLRPRRYNRQLIPKVNKLCDSNFIQRMLYKDSYWLSFFIICIILRVELRSVIS